MNGNGEKKKAKLIWAWPSADPNFPNNLEFDVHLSIHWHSWSGATVSSHARKRNALWKCRGYPRKVSSYGVGSTCEGNLLHHHDRPGKTKRSIFQSLVAYESSEQVINHPFTWFSAKLSLSYPWGVLNDNDWVNSHLGLQDALH